jgi:hypothetical protein
LSVPAGFGCVALFSFVDVAHLCIGNPDKRGEKND